MSQPPLLERQRLVRASMVGAGLGILGIVLFGGIWIGLEALEVDVLPRVLVALCVPPLVMGGLMAGYLLMNRS